MSIHANIGGTYRESEESWVKVADVWRKVKSVSVNVGGVWREGYLFRELKYHGVATPLLERSAYLAAETIGNYALFAGGTRNVHTYKNELSSVNAYSTALVRTTPTALSAARQRIPTSTVGNYALFGGGSAYVDPLDVVDAYSTALVRTTPTNHSVFGDSRVGAKVISHALFEIANTNNYVSSLDAYNTSLVRTTSSDLYDPRRERYVGVASGNHALFGGGYSYPRDSYDLVVAYNNSLVRTIPTKLSAARFDLAAVTVGNYALFGGGGNTSLDLNTVDAYNASLVRTVPTVLSAARDDLAATSVGDCALFGGGRSSGGINNREVDVYNSSLVRTTITPLGTGRSNLAATTVGDYAIFGGGTQYNPDGDNYVISTVDAYSYN